MHITVGEMEAGLFSIGLVFLCDPLPIFKIFIFTPCLYLVHFYIGDTRSTKLNIIFDLLPSISDCLDSLYIVIIVICH